MNADSLTRSGTFSGAQALGAAAARTPGAAVIVDDVHKSFGAVQALRGVSLSIEAGTIHALVGENGAGKSTLGKIIGGMLHADAGQLLVDGVQRRYRSPRAALDDGLTIIAQEVLVVPARTVEENVFLGRFPQRFGRVDRGELRRRYDDLVQRAGFRLPPDVLVGHLRLADQQKVEILRGLARNARLMVLDEPTAALTADESEQLFRIVRALRDQGTTIVYVSHFLKEVLSLADSVTVLRDGEVVATSPAAEENEGSLIRKMIGRPLDRAFPPQVAVAADAPEVLRVEDLSVAGVIDDIALSVKAGEILGFAGLIGSGRSEVAHALAGSLPLSSGTIHLDGAPVSSRSPRDARQAGIALLPESRKTQGLMLGRSISENVSLPHLRRLSRLGVMSRRKERRAVKAIIDRLDVRAPDLRTEVQNLSGGNQQKVLFAKCLLDTPKLLIADEPTRGVDVGAKRAIYDVIASLAADGMAIVLISSELDEVLALSHRICVMKEGRIVKTMNKEEISESSVIAAAFGTNQEASV